MELVEAPRSGDTAAGTALELGTGTPELVRKGRKLAGEGSPGAQNGLRKGTGVCTSAPMGTGWEMCAEQEKEGSAESIGGAGEGLARLPMQLGAREGSWPVCVGERGGTTLQGPEPEAPEMLAPAETQQILESCFGGKEGCNGASVRIVGPDPKAWKRHGGRAARLVGRAL